MLSIIIPTLHQWDYYEKIIKNIEDVYKEQYEIITIEDKLVNEARNLGVEQSKGDYILIINDDIVIPKWCIESMMEILEECSIACPYYSRWDDAFGFNNNGDNIVGFCFMLKRKDIDRCFPIPKELQLYYGDNYIYERLYRDVWFTDIPIHHRESKTLKSDEMFEKCKLITQEDRRQWIQIKKQFIR